jgi:hypothetical protein
MHITEHSSRTAAATPVDHKMANQRKSKARNFYIISWSDRHGLADFEVENLDVLRAGAGALYPPEGRQGFPNYPERPRVVIGKRKRGPPPSDIELFHSHWLVSDRLKLLFESFDPPAFAFQACDVSLRDGSTGPVYWLCDVVRVLEAFAESTLREIQQYRERTGFRYRGFRGDKTLVFNEGVIGDSHIFRTPYSRNDVFCDQSLKDACKDAGVKGVAFHDCKPGARPPVPPDVKAQGGSTSLQGLSNRLLTLGDATKPASLAIAARSALRAIPLLARLSWDKPLRKRMRASVGRPRMSNSAIVLGTFRSLATAWVAARFHAFGMSDRFHEIKHAARMAGGAEDAGKTAASAAPMAAHMAMMAAMSVFSHRLPESSFGESRNRESSARSAIQTAAVAAHGFMEAYDPQAAELSYASRDPHLIKTRELCKAERAIWDAAWEDVRRLENGGGDTQSLLMQPLWLTAPPRYVLDDWKDLSARLIGRGDENWSVWIDWYGARLGGGGVLSEKDEIARVSLPDEVWGQGAAFANASISGLAA